MSEALKPPCLENKAQQIDWAYLFKQRLEQFDQQKDFPIYHIQHIFGKFAEKINGKIIPVAWFEPEKDCDDDTIELFISSEPIIDTTFPHYELEDALKDHFFKAGIECPEHFIPYSAYLFEEINTNGGGY